MSMNKHTSLPRKPGTETPRGWKLGAWLLTKQRTQERDREEKASKEGWWGCKISWEPAFLLPGMYPRGRKTGVRQKLSAGQPYS